MSNRSHGDMLATLCSVVERRSLGSSSQASASKARFCWQAQLGRRIRRWHVWLGNKRGDRIGKTKRGKGTKLMVLADGNGIPLAIDIASANRSEVTLIEPLIDSAVTEHVPPRLIYTCVLELSELGKNGASAIPALTAACNDKQLSRAATFALSKIQQE